MKSASNSTILVIEDDEAVRDVLTMVLEVHGFRVVAATNGAEGLEAAKREGPVIVITDINMPGMTGFQLLEQFRRDETLHSIPVILVSARVEREDIRRGMELGAADFISKPFSEEELLNSVKARLEQKALLDELDSFAHTVAHDLRNPLSTLTMRLELLELQVGRSSEAEQREHITSARHASDRLASIIEELLVLTGVRRQTVDPYPLNMDKIVTESIDRVDQLFKKHGVTVQKPGSWPTAFGHAPWVMEIWVNYLSNAAKYGGNEPHLTLGGTTSADGRFARYWVQDQGPGLEQELQRKLCVPFTNISSARASGHGLGLSIVQRIAEKLGGTVGVETKVGAGARFWFELPTGASPNTRSPFL